MSQAWDEHLDQVKHRARQGWQLLVVAALILAGMWYCGSGSGSKKAAPTQPETSRVVAEPGRGRWELVEHPQLADLVGVSFAPDGAAGVAADSAGRMVTSFDGGVTWMPGRSVVPLEDGELLNVIRTSARDQVLAATGMDASRYTAIYTTGFTTGWAGPVAAVASDARNEWQKLEGEWGGVAGASADGSVLVGGGGFVALRREAEGWDFRQLAAAREITLYAAARIGDHLVVVGDYGFLGRSVDGGRSWTAERVGEAALYAVAVSPEVTIAGGSGGLWREVDGVWTRATNLAATAKVQAVLIDGKAAFAVGESEGGSALALHSLDGGRTWRVEATNNSAGAIIALAQSRRGIFAATNNGRLLRRTE